MALRYHGFQVRLCPHGPIVRENEFPSCAQLINRQQADAEAKVLAVGGAAPAEGTTEAVEDSTVEMATE